MSVQQCIETIAAFHEPYRDKHLESVEETECGDDPFRLRFFLKKAMAGARHESTSADYREAAEAVINQHEDRIKEWVDGGAGIEQDEFERMLCEEELTNGADRQMVYDIINDLLTDLDGEPDFVEYTKTKITDGEIDLVYDRLTDVHNIAQKKAALFLRDTVDIWDLEDQLSQDDYRYVFPVDTQVRQVATRTGIVGKDVSRNQLITSGIKACRQSEVSPITFNQGAWYLGANSFEVVMDNLDKL